ncbi:MAG: PAS domain S-box protein [Nitrospira sp.]|nr:PAS domain S-box protein [Nitrospira sp.]
MDFSLLLRRPAVRVYAAPLIGCLTLAIFLVDLNAPIDMAPWLPYLALAVAVAHLYDPKRLILATVLWSLAILGEPMIRSHADDAFEKVFNRTLGVVTLWIATGFLYAGLVAPRNRQPSDSHLEAIVSGALDAVVTMDRTGHVIEWNPQAVTIFGYSRDEAIGKLLADLIIPARYRQAHTKGLERFLSTGEETILRRRIEITAIRKSGEEFPVELTVLPILAGNDQLFSSFIRDITERKRSERQVQQSTDFIESLFEHLPNMVFVKDAKDLRFVRFNKAGEELLGYSRSELLGKTDYDFFAKEEADFFTAKDRETLRKKQLIDIPDEPIQTKSKGVRILHTKKITICDNTGAPQYLLGISEDITERKQAERALVESRAKSDFLANMSHEMRTPLTAIMGIADYLARTSLTHEQLTLVNRCTKASEGLLRMIEDLLLAAKAESGTLALVSEAFTLREVALECINLLTPEAQEKDLALKVEFDPSLPARLTGDAYRLQQVLLNLIRNAVKFTPTGSILVRAKAWVIEPPVCTVQFSVTDTGIGIPEDLRERLFERFSQADLRTNRQYGGVGLGLSICKQLVVLMGGRIWFERMPGGGSTFSFILPLGISKQNEQTRLSTSPQNTTGPLRSSSSLCPSVRREARILLAEDSVESQHVMRLYLSRTPHHLDCAESGTSVVEAFKSSRYDLVLMDLHMPDIDGYEATRRIRAWEKEQDLPRTPIVALTADGFAESRQKSLAAGCDDFLTKPIKMDAVFNTIQQYVADAETPLPQNRPPHTYDAGALDADLRRLRPRFLRNRHDDVLTLRAAVDNGDFERIRTIGHRMKGVAGSYGLPGIGTIGAAIEQAALDRRLDRVTASVADLVEAIREAEQRDSPHCVEPSSSPQPSKGAAS